MKTSNMSLLLIVLIAGVFGAEDRTDNLVFLNGNDDSNFQSDDFMRINKDNYYRTSDTYRNTDNYRNTNAYRNTDTSRNNGESYRNIDSFRNTDTYRNVETQRRQPSQMRNNNGKTMPAMMAAILELPRSTSTSINGNGVTKDYQGHGYYTKPINGLDMAMARGNIKSWNAGTNGRNVNGAISLNGNGQYRAMTSNGVIMTSNGVVSNGVVSNGLVSNGLMSNGLLTSNGLMTSNGLAVTSNGNGQYMSIMMPVGRSVYDGINLVAADYRSPQQYSTEQVVPSSAFASYGSYGTSNGYVIPSQPIGVTYGTILPSYSTGYVGYGGTSTNPAPVESAYSAPLAFSTPYGSSVPAMSYNSPVPVAYGAPVPITYSTPVQVYSAPVTAADYSDTYPTDYQSAYPESSSSDTPGEDYTVYSSAVQVTNGENGNGDASSASTTSGTEGRSMFFNGKSNGNGNGQSTFNGKSISNGNVNGQVNGNGKINGNGSVNGHVNGNGLVNGNGRVNGNGNGNGLVNGNGHATGNGNGNGLVNGGGNGNGLVNGNGNGKARFNQPIGDDYQHANTMKFTKSSEIQKMRGNSGSYYY